MENPRTLIALDGRTLEGGGQLLRVALCLSSLTGVPVRVSHIRGNRGALSRTGIGKDGGLKAAHLAAVHWLAKATLAVTEGMELRSTDLLFKPTKSILQDESSFSAPIWTDIYDSGCLIRRESHVSMSTAGSVLLILQAILPYVLYLPSAVPLCIKIEGGTNVSKSPSIEYVSQVLLPLLSTKLGIQPIGVHIHKRGWSTGRIEVGSVTFKITPRQPGSIQPAFQFINRGNLEKVYISVIAPEDGSRHRIKSEALKQLGQVMPKAELVLIVDEDSGDSQHIYFLLVAETSCGFRLGRDCLLGRKTAKLKKKSERTVEEQDAKMVSSIIKELQHELSWGGCVDEYMEDQLVIFQALAQGHSEVDVGKGRQASLHTRTARWVVDETLGIDIHGGKGDGIGLKVGEAFGKQTEAGETTITQHEE